MKIIYKTETGISIVHPTGELSIEAVFEKDVPQEYKASALIVDDDFVFPDRSYRNAWDFVDGKVIEDITKAKEIHKDKLRAERKPLLEAQDILYMKALENNTDVVEIIKEKQRLRDITKEVDKVDTIENLKKVGI